MEIELPADIEQALAEAAKKRGISPESLALEYLHEYFLGSRPSAPDKEEPANMGDFLADHIGVLDSSEFVSGPSDLSEDTGRRFTEGLRKQREEGRL